MQPGLPLWWCWLIPVPGRSPSSAGASVGAPWEEPLLSSCTGLEGAGTPQSSYDLQKQAGLKDMRNGAGDRQTDRDRQIQWTECDSCWKTGNTKVKVAKFCSFSRINEQNNFFFCQLAVLQTVENLFSMLSFILTLYGVFTCRKQCEIH